MSSPKLLAKQRQPANVGLYEYQHTELKQKPRLLSSHVLPGVDIRPQLVVESIPGLVIPGTTEKLSPRIRVDYVNKENSSPSKSNPPSVVVSQVATALGVQAETNNDISITDSTTSKFEEVEKLVQKVSTEDVIKLQLRKRVREILMEKYDLKQEEISLDMANKNVNLTDHYSHQDSLQDISLVDKASIIKPDTLVVPDLNQAETSEESSALGNQSQPIKVNLDNQEIYLSVEREPTDESNSSVMSPRLDSVSEDAPLPHQHTYGSSKNSPSPPQYTDSFEDESRTSSGESAAARSKLPSKGDGLDNY